MCEMTHSYVCYDPFVCVTRPILMCAMTQSHTTAFHVVGILIDGVGTVKERHC